MCSAVEDGPGNAARVLSLKEEGLRLAILESENLAVASDVEFTLLKFQRISHRPLPRRVYPPGQGPILLSPCLPRFMKFRQRHRWCCDSSGSWGEVYLSRVDPLARERVVVGTHLVALASFVAARCRELDRDLAMGGKVDGRDTFNFSNRWCVLVTNQPRAGASLDGAHSRHVPKSRDSLR